MDKKVSIDLSPLQLARLEQMPAVIAAARANPLIRSQHSIMAVLEEVGDIAIALAMQAADMEDPPAAAPYNRQQRTRRKEVDIHLKVPWEAGGITPPGK